MNNINIFISSAFRNMHLQRDTLIYNVRPMVDQKLKKAGYEAHLNFVDLRWGVDERMSQDSLGMNAQILETCFRALDESDVFVGLYTEYRGTFIPENEIDLLNEQYNWKLPYGSSLTELEHWYCKNVKKRKTKYCQVFFESGDMSDDISTVDNYITVKGNPVDQLTLILSERITELIIEILQKEDQYIDIKEPLSFEQKEAYNSAESLLNELFDTSSSIPQKYRRHFDDGSMVLRYDVIHEIIEDVLLSDEVFRAFEDDSNVQDGLKLTVVTGESGIGKSVLLGQLNDQIERQQLLTPVYLADATHASALDELLEEAFTVYEVNCSEELTSLADKIRYLREHIDWFKIPCFIIDSIDDLSPEYFYHFLIELNHNFPICHVITSTTKTEHHSRFGSFLFKTIELDSFNKNELEIAVNLYERMMLKHFPQKIRKILLGLEQTEFAKPIVFRLVLNDLALLSLDDYQSILNSAEYSLQIENIMLKRFKNYPVDIDGIINEICGRIAGKSGNLQNVEITKKYLAAIILSYKGVDEEYLKKVFMQEWKPLQFYQLKYSFQSVFTEHYGLLRFSHHLFKETFFKIIPKSILDVVAKQIIENVDMESIDLGYEKYRMLFFVEDYESWLSEVRKKEYGWDYLSACLNEYCQKITPNRKTYLSVPTHWIDYMQKCAEDGSLSNHDYEMITSNLYGFINEVSQTASVEFLDDIIECCKKFLNAFFAFAKNATDNRIVLSCKEIAAYYYERVISCASEFASHEKVKTLVEEYEQLLYSEQFGAIFKEEDVGQRMWQLYNLAKYKEETDGERSVVVGLYIQLLKLSQREKTIFPNFGHVFEFLLVHSSEIDYLKEYLAYAIAFLDDISKNKGGYSKDEVTFMIRVYHCKLMVDGHLGMLNKNIDEIKPLIIKEYAYAQRIHEKYPNEVEYIYDYSMACADLTIICTITKDYNKVKALLRTNQKLKEHLCNRFPETFLFAESYSAFLHNCANYENVFEEDERVEFVVESFNVLNPFLRLRNIKSSWSYLNHWEMIVSAIQDDGDINNYYRHVLEALKSNLQYLPDVLNLIFEADEGNITFRKEAMARIGEIYNVYRAIAEKTILRILAKAIYDIAIQICEIEDSDSSYSFLASVIETLCADQAASTSDTTVDDLQLLKVYEEYIESKIIQSPQRVVLHKAMMKVPETEILQMVGMLAGIEKMPKQIQFIMRMAWERLDVDPVRIIIDSATKMMKRMETIVLLDAKVSPNSIEIVQKVLSYLLTKEEISIEQKEQIKKILEGLYIFE